MPRKLRVVENLPKPATFVSPEKGFDASEAEMLDPMNPKQFKRASFHKVLRAARSPEMNHLKKHFATPAPLTDEAREHLEEIKNELHKAEADHSRVRYAELKLKLVFVLKVVHGIDEFQFNDGTVARVIPDANPPPAFVNAARRERELQRSARGQDPIKQSPPKHDRPGTWTVKLFK